MVGEHESITVTRADETRAYIVDMAFQLAELATKIGAIDLSQRLLEAVSTESPPDFRDHDGNDER